MASSNPLDPTNFLALVYDVNTRWHSGTGQVTYSLLTSVPNYYPMWDGNYQVDYISVSPSANVSLNAAQRTMAQLAVRAWNEVCNVNIVLASSGVGQITFASTDFQDPGFYGLAFPPSSDDPTSGDIWLNSANPIVANPTSDDEGWNTFIHELGHAIGLSHPFGGGQATLPSTLDNAQYSVMSYDPHPGQAGIPDPAQLWSITPMVYDIQAAQYLYGANYATRGGGTTYFGPTVSGTSRAFALANGQDVILTIWDGGGSDWFNLSNQSEASVIDLRPGHFSSVGGLTNNVATAFLYGNDPRSLIENAIGSIASDTIHGNQAVNDLRGNGGNDTIRGYAGNDYIRGDAGIDTLYGDNDASAANAGNDHLFGGLGGDRHFGGGGFDYARYDDANYGNLVVRLDNPSLNTGAAAGDTYTSIEGIISGLGNDSIHGNSYANRLYGGGGDDRIYGNAGDDTLNGGAGADHLYGGLGADAHVGGDGPGYDYARYDDANYGNLTIRLDNASLGTGAAKGDTFVGIEAIVGGVGADTIVGNAALNRFFGGEGNDRLFGAGGNDYLYGGPGSDRFAFNTALNAATNVDTIGDFTVGVDDIQLHASIFAVIGAVLDVSEFRRATAACDANDYILYNSANGRIYFDYDGSRTNATAIHFATVTAGLNLTAGDFIVV